MRRSHVYERSAPRPARSAYWEPAPDAAAVAREIADALPAMADRAEAAGLTMLVYLLRVTADEAYKRARE